MIKFFFLIGDTHLFVDVDVDVGFGGGEGAGS